MRMVMMCWQAWLDGYVTMSLLIMLPCRPPTRSSVFKVRSLCKLTRSSPQRMEGFFECIKLSNTHQESRAKERRVPFTPLLLRVLIIDVVTRWNSLYFMLERAHMFQKVNLYHSLATFLSLSSHKNRLSMSSTCTIFMVNFTRITCSLTQIGG